MSDISEIRWDKQLQFFVVVLLFREVHPYLSVDFFYTNTTIWYIICDNKKLLSILHIQMNV